MKHILEILKILFLLLTTSTFSFEIDYFPFDLAEKIEETNQGNWLFSPYSISTCLAMLERGAKGQTAGELEKVLNIKSVISPQQIRHSPSTESDFDLRVIQGLWVKNDFYLLESYTNSIRESYQAVADCVSFNPETYQTINRWVAENTEQKINNILGQNSLNDFTRLLLANALYFRGSWIHPFKSTQTLPFYPVTGSAVKIPFIAQINEFDYAENDQGQAILLPFYSLCKTCEPACCIILPKAEIPMTQTLFNSLYTHLTKKTVHLFVPQFSIEWNIDLKNPLMDLGIQIAFTESADFSNMDGRGELFLSQVLHKAFFSLDKSGVEAAAATLAAISSTNFIHFENPFPFVINRPFYFFLLDRKTETILFFGKYQTPKI